MALKSSPKLAENVQIGDFITRRNVLKNKIELFRITLVRNTGDRFAFNYADAHTGQEVDHFTAQRGDTVFTIIHED